MECRLAVAANLMAEPSSDSAKLAALTAGTTLRILDKSRGWAWGYAGALVGYVPAAALTA